MMFKFRHVLMNVAGEGADGGAGGMSEDDRARARGDFLDNDDADAKAAADAAAKADADADAKAAADAAVAELAKDKAGEDEDKDKARDDKGRFTKKDDDHRIPKAEFDKRIEKERQAREQAEQRAAEAEAKLKKEERTDQVAKMEEGVAALEAKHAQLILDGDTKEAAKVMREIRMAERQIVEMESNEKLRRATAQAVEQVRMDAAIAGAQAKYPQLNDESEQFDEALVNFVLAEHRRLMDEKGMSPSAAMISASDSVMSRLVPPSRDTKSDEGKGLDKARGAAADRTKDQVAKNIDTAKNQPASMRDTGLDSDKAGAKDSLPDITKLSYDEFQALPEATKARMRGDFA